MVGGENTYPVSRARAEFVVRAHLQSRRGRDEPGRTAATVHFAHFVDENAGGVHQGPEPALPIIPPV